MVLWFAFVVVACEQLTGEKGAVISVSAPSVIFLVKGFSVLFLLTQRAAWFHLGFVFSFFFFCCCVFLFSFLSFAFLLLVLSEDDAFIDKPPAFERRRETPAGIVLAEHGQDLWLRSGRLRAPRAPDTRRSQHLA